VLHMSIASLDLDQVGRAGALATGQCAGRAASAAPGCRSRCGGAGAACRQHRLLVAGCRGLRAVASAPRPALPQPAPRCSPPAAAPPPPPTQVIRLCEAHRLYSALAYVHNRILDFRRPLLDLLRAVASAASAEEQQRFGYKLLVYLRCAPVGGSVCVRA
jgi:hypothetical protein